MLDPLGSFNLLMPKDRASARVAMDVAYGQGERLKLDVYAPRSAAARPRPVILFYYGGSWNSGRRQDYAFAARALAARGFLVVVPDYRLVPGARYPDFLKDCAAALRWARRHPANWRRRRDTRPDGHSAGAYKAAMLRSTRAFSGRTGPRSRGLSSACRALDFLPPTMVRRSPLSGAGPVPPKPTHQLTPRPASAGSSPARRRRFEGQTRKSQKLAGSAHAQRAATSG